MEDLRIILNILCSGAVQLSILQRKCNTATKFIVCVDQRRSSAPHNSQKRGKDPKSGACLLLQLLKMVSGTASAHILHDVMNVSFIGLVYFLFCRLHRSKGLLRNAPGNVGVEGGKFWPQSCVPLMIQCHCTQLTCSTLHYSTVHTVLCKHSLDTSN